MQCPEYLLFETPVGRTLIWYWIALSVHKLLMSVSCWGGWRWCVLSYQFHIIPFYFQGVSKREKFKVLMSFWSLVVDLSYITGQSDCAYFFPVLFLTLFTLPMLDLEIIELPEPLDRMLKIITIRNNMFLLINAILMESAYFELQRWKNKFLSFSLLIPFAQCAYVCQKIQGAGQLLFVHKYSYLYRWEGKISDRLA